MRWFKHDSDASADAKLKRVRMKYGMAGYGLYWYCLELIAMGVEANKLTFELEHDAEIIAHDTGINYAVVQEMMVYMCDLGLFENTDGRITCLKMATRLDQSMTSNPAMRKVISGIKNHDGIMTESSEPVTESCKIRLDENRLDKNRKESRTKRTRFIPPTIEEVSARCIEMGYSVNPDRFVSHYSANGWKVGRNPMKCWKSALAGWQTRDNDGAQQRPPTNQPKETAAQRMRRELEIQERIIQ